MFAPEKAPPDMATAGGGLLPLRPGNVIASSEDAMAAMTLRADVDYMTEHYPSISAPIGILFGRDDPILDWRIHGAAMKRKLPTLDLELVDGGHMLPVTQPDVCAAFIRKIALKAHKNVEGVT